MQLDNLMIQGCLGVLNQLEFQVHAPIFFYSNPIQHSVDNILQIMT